MHISPPPGAMRFLLEAIENASRSALLHGASADDIFAAVVRAHDVQLQPREVLPE